MKTAKITAKINNSNPINDWVQGFELKMSNGSKKVFAHRYQAQAYAKKLGYKLV